MSAISTVTALPFLLLLVLAGAVAAGVNSLAALNLLAGGMAVVLPNALFARLAFRHAGARQAQQIVRSFYLGEALKLVLTAGLLVCVFVWVNPLVPAAIFAGFVSMQLACGVAATRLKKFLPNRRS